MHFVLTTSSSLIWKKSRSWRCTTSYTSSILCPNIFVGTWFQICGATFCRNGDKPRERIETMHKTTFYGSQWLWYRLRRNPCRVSHGFRFHWSSGQQVVCRRSVSINLMNSHSEVLSGDRAPWPKLSKRNRPDFCYIRMVCVTVLPTGVVGLHTGEIIIMGNLSYAWSHFLSSSIAIQDFSRGHSHDYFMFVVAV